MNEEKQIEEMTKYCHFYEDGNCTLGEELGVECDSKCDMCEFAKRLYNAGYRKASEVALEVIGEIEKIIDKHYNNHIFGNNDLDDLEHDAIINFSDDVTHDIDDLKKKYSEGER